MKEKRKEKNEGKKYEGRKKKNKNEGKKKIDVEDFVVCTAVAAYALFCASLSVWSLYLINIPWEWFIDKNSGSELDKRSDSTCVKLLHCENISSFSLITKWRL